MRVTPNYKITLDFGSFSRTFYCDKWDADYLGNLLRSFVFNTDQVKITVEENK